MDKDMEEVDKKAQEYCEKNIPDMPGMHLTVSTAFEAGWEAAFKYLSEIPWDEAMDKIVERCKRKVMDFEWIKTCDETPEEGETVYCYPDEMLLEWNGLYWEEHYEDFTCEEEEVKVWTRIPKLGESDAWKRSSEEQPEDKDGNVILLLEGKPVLGLGSTVGFVPEITHWMECPKFIDD